MIIGLLFPILVVVFIVMITRRAQRGGKEGITGNEIRRFFQYLLLYGLVVLAAVGASGLLGQFFSRTSELVIGSATLARNVSFLIVGLPLALLLAKWSKRTVAEDVNSSAWMFYVTAVALTSLILVLTGVNELVSSLLRTQGLNGRSLSQVLVWGFIWTIHWRVDNRTPQQERRIHHILGSLVGLVTSVIGLASLIGGLLATLIHSTSNVLVTGYNPTRSGVALLVAGLPTWFWYWLKTTYRRERDDAWNGYVLLAGVAGGLVMTVVATSMVLYRALVWLIGDPATSDATRYFTNMPTTIGVALTGGLVWWYHQAVLAEGVQTRTEVRRVYEYLISGISIVSAAVGLSILVVSGIEAITRSNEIMGQTPINTLISAMTLLVIALPIWYLFWSRITKAVVNDPKPEHLSPSRRAYLFILFGIGGVVAVISLTMGVYFLFQGIFESRFGVATLRRMRTPIGVLISTATISGFHWQVYRKDRTQIGEVHRGLRFVLLVGPRDPDLIRRIQRETGARVEVREVLDSSVTWSSDSVLSALLEARVNAVVVLAERTEVIAIRG